MNSIQEMRDRLTKRFNASLDIPQGYSLSQYRPTANNAPRLPQSTIPGGKAKYESAGRPSADSKPLPEFQKRPKDIFGGWL